MVFQFKANESIRSLSHPSLPITDPKKKIKDGVLLLLGITSINHVKYGDLQGAWIYLCETEMNLFS